VGCADVWLRRSGLHKQQLSWTQFSDEVVQRFSGYSTYELPEKFNTLKQNNMSIKEYTEIFEELMEDILEENPDLQEEWFIKCYVNGMKDSIKSQLRPLRPTSLTSAYWQAKEMEQSQQAAMLAKRSYVPQFQKFSSLNTYKQQAPTTGGSKPPVPQPQPHKPRVKGECWRCDDPNWQPSHKCRQIPVLNYISQMLEQDQPENDREETTEATTDDPPTQLMNISLQALGKTNYLYYTHISHYS
jgi:hypothetical protein